MTEHQQRYFEVSTTKFVVMSIVTFGIYDFFWFYRQWQCENARTGEHLSPFWRTFFSPLWAFSLFRRISAGAEETGSRPFAHTAWAILFFLVQGTWRLPTPWVLIAFLTFVPLIPAQAAVGRINHALAPDAPRNDRYTLANVAMIFVGGLFLLLVIIGALLPTLEPIPEEPVNVSV